MTQLLGFNSNIVLDFDFVYKSSLAKDKLPDGLGYAYHDSNNWTVWKKLIENEGKIIEQGLLNPHHFQAQTFVSHIRYASIGVKKLENTHPFIRELFDSEYVFAHSGHLRMYRAVELLEKYKPFGDTDSEEAFCMILEKLHKHRQVRNDSAKAKLIEEIANELAKQGGVNFLLTDGKTIFVYYSGYKSLNYLVLKPPHTNNVICEDIDFKLTIRCKDKPVSLTLISSEPISVHEKWQNFEPRKIYFFKEGIHMKGYQI